MTTNSKAVLGRLAKMRLVVKIRRRGVHKGTRRASQIGSSLEFSDFRVYHPGDDVRQIDWNIYGRTHKHYIKRFLDEQEINVAVLLDATISMQTIDTKWKRAKEIAAAFSFISLAGDDRLSFVPVSADYSKRFTRKGSVYSKAVLIEIGQLPRLESKGSFSENLQKNNLKNIQMAIIITDGLEELASYELLFRTFRSAGKEVILIQLLSQQELEPEYTGDLKLVDSETAEVLNVSMHEAVLSNYQKRVTEHCRKLEELAKRFGFHYLLTTDIADLQEFLFHECRARRVLR